MFSSRNQQISPVREQGGRSRRYAVLRRTSVCRNRLFNRFLVVWPRATARLGRGSFVFIVLGNAEPRLGKCNDLRLFCIHTKYGEVLCGTGVNSIGVNDGAFNEF